MADQAQRPAWEDATLRLYIVAGEHSGDALGAKLMASLRALTDGDVAFAGLGGAAMEAEGLASIFSLDEVTVMGPVAIAKAYPRLRRRALECVAGAVAASPDALVIIDAPEFTHPIAKRVRAQRPQIPIIGYVSPSVWAWRPGRAKKMRPYVDHLLAILPFEPDAHARLGGPPCTYVGHPLSERIAEIQGVDPEPLRARLALDPAAKTLVVLPGSRSSEVAHLMHPFGDTVGALVREGRALNVLLPAVPRQADAIRSAIQDWPVTPHLLQGEEDKWRAFRLADAALAASGTVTLELAIAATPMVVAYKVDRVAALLRFLVKVPSIVLPNLVLGQSVFPEFIQERCTADDIAPVLARLLDDDSPDRARQIAAFDRLALEMTPDGATPSARAAEVVLGVLKRDAS